VAIERHNSHFPGSQPAKLVLGKTSVITPPNKGKKDKIPIAERSFEVATAK
jgi:hypothetical protein